MTQSPLQPFAFDTEFDASGAVVASGSRSALRRIYPAAEVEALLAQARAEARQAAMEEIEGVRAMALTQIGQALGQAMPSLATVAHQHRTASAELAVAAARTIAASALDRYPQGPMKAALEALGQEADASPRLVVRASGLDDEARRAIEAVAVEAGFSGQVSFRDLPEREVAAFTLEWADGRAAYSPEDTARRVAETLASALAAEGGHTEAIHPNSPEGAF